MKLSSVWYQLSSHWRKDDRSRQTASSGYQTPSSGYQTGQYNPEHVDPFSKQGLSHRPRPRTSHPRDRKSKRFSVWRSGNTDERPPSYDTSNKLNGRSTANPAPSVTRTHVTTTTGGHDPFSSKPASGPSQKWRRSTPLIPSSPRPTGALRKRRSFFGGTPDDDDDDDPTVPAVPIMHVLGGHTTPRPRSLYLKAYCDHPAEPATAIAPVAPHDSRRGDADTLKRRRSSRHLSIPAGLRSFGALRSKSDVPSPPDDLAAADAPQVSKLSPQRRADSRSLVDLSPPFDPAAAYPYEQTQDPYAPAARLMARNSDAAVPVRPPGDPHHHNQNLEQHNRHSHSQYDLHSESRSQLRPVQPPHRDPDRRASYVYGASAPTAGARRSWRRSQPDLSGPGADAWDRMDHEQRLEWEKFKRLMGMIDHDRDGSVGGSVGGGGGGGGGVSEANNVANGSRANGAEAYQRLDGLRMNDAEAYYGAHGRRGSVADAYYEANFGHRASSGAAAPQGDRRHANAQALAALEFGVAS